MKFKKYATVFFLILTASCFAQKSRIITTKDKDKNSKTSLYFSKTETKPVVDIKNNATKTNDSIVKKMPEIISDNLSLKKIEKDSVKPKVAEEIQVLVATSNVKVTRDMVNAYINAYSQISKNEMVKYKIPASITLAQGILESGSGTGALSMQANNHFGIKCHENWKGASVRYDDDVPDECFRKYDNPNKSFEDHSVFLKTRPWYNPLFKLQIDDYKGWARGLKKAGYATDIKYPEKLISIIESYNLTKFDNEVLGKEAVELFENKKPVKSDIEIPVDDKTIKIEDPKDKIIIEPTKIEALETIKTDIEDKTLKTYTVLPKEGLYSISKKFNKTVDELKKLNNLKDNTINVGQVLIIK